MSRQQFHKGDKVLIDDAGQQFTTHYIAIAQMFCNNNLDLRTVAKFRFTKQIKKKEMDWDREQSRFIVVAVMDNHNSSIDRKNTQFCLIENKKHVYLIGNGGLRLCYLPSNQGKPDTTQEETGVVSQESLE